MFRNRCLFLILIFVGGCATLPDYAAPKMSVLDEDEVDLSDVIEYRELQVADFKGAAPPKGFDHRMAAVTCVYAEPVIDRDAIDIEFDYRTDGRPIYRIRLNNLRYRALMDRNCSWWNPNTGIDDLAYTLEHEQIHFALFELATRRWNREQPLEFEFDAADEDVLADKLLRKFRAQFEDKLDRLNAENRRFDAQTSIDFNPQLQNAWHQRVMTGLARISPPQACVMGAAARAAIERARELTPASSRVAELIAAAEAAAGPPECDSVRAKILADKAIDLVGD